MRTQSATARARGVAQIEDIIRELQHDIRQPIAAISALVAAAAVVPDISEEVHRRLSQINDEAVRISALVQQALTGSTATGPLDVGDVAGSVAESFATSTGSTVQVVADADAMLVVDETGLRRAIANLIDNAIRAAGRGGSVLVTVQTKRGRVRIDVHDSGPGFGSGPQGVAGLGLVIVQRFASSNDGEVTFGHSHLGGTVARLEFPAPARAQDPLLTEAVT